MFRLVSIFSLSFSLREKVAEGRMRGQQCTNGPIFPLTLALSLMERGLFEPTVFQRRR